MVIHVRLTPENDRRKSKLIELMKKRARLRELLREEEKFLEPTVRPAVVALLAEVEGRKWAIQKRPSETESTHRIFVVLVYFLALLVVGCWYDVSSTTTRGTRRGRGLMLSNRCGEFGVEEGKGVSRVGNSV